MPVVPKQKLQPTKVYDTQCQLVPFGFRKFEEAEALRVIRLTSHKTGEWIYCTLIGNGKLFVGVYAFHLQQVGIRAMESCRATVIMHINYQFAPSRLDDCVVQPGGPLLGPEITTSLFDKMARMCSTHTACGPAK
jgi:hypothetical protein